MEEALYAFASMRQDYRIPLTELLRDVDTPVGQRRYAPLLGVLVKAPFACESATAPCRSGPSGCSSVGSGPPGHRRSGCATPPTGRRCDAPCARRPQPHSAFLQSLGQGDEALAAQDHLSMLEPEKASRK